MYSSSTNTKRFLISFSNKLYMTKLNTLLENTQFMKNNTPQIITGQISKTEADREATIQELLPLSGNIVLNYFLMCKHGNLEIKIDREPVEHLDALKSSSDRNAATN
jgi:hypothetical protein